MTRDRDRHRDTSDRRARRHVTRSARCCCATSAVLRKEKWMFLGRTVMQPFLLIFVFTYVFPKIGQAIGGARRRGLLDAARRRRRSRAR